MNSGGALAAGVGVSSDGIGEKMLPGYFVLIESQDEIPDASRSIYILMRVANRRFKTALNATLVRSVRHHHPI